MMFLYVLFHLVVYGGMNAYCCWKIISALPGRVGLRIGVAAAVALLAVAPLLARASVSRLALLCVMAGYVWIAVAVWILFFGLCFDVWNLAVKVLGRLEPRAARLALKPRLTMILLCAIVAALGGWGVHEARAITLKEIRLECSRLPARSKPIRIVQLTDVHLGAGVGERRFRRIVSVVREARPDLVVCTGDMVDASFRRLGPLAALLAEVRPPLGKFAVTGNHEYYLGLDESLKFYAAAGYHVLREESVLVGGRLRLAGVDDPAGIRMGGPCRTDENAALPTGEDREATILLKHQPTVEPGSAGRFDLQLSGHTHGGQIFPVTLAVRALWCYPYGLHELGRGSLIYVSRGAGTWGPPLRVLARPEVTLITLLPPGADPAVATNRSGTGDNTP